MNTNDECDKEDIMTVVTQLGYDTPTDEQIDEMIGDYDSMADSDPTGWHAVWIEQLLDNVGVVQRNFTTPKKEII